MKPLPSPPTNKCRAQGSKSPSLIAWPPSYKLVPKDKAVRTAARSASLELPLSDDATSLDEAKAIRWMAFCDWWGQGDNETRNQFLERETAFAAKNSDVRGAAEKEGVFLKDGDWELHWASEDSDEVREKLLHRCCAHSHSGPGFSYCTFARGIDTTPDNDSCRPGDASSDGKYFGTGTAGAAGAGSATNLIGFLR